MKKLILFILLFISFKCSSQTFNNNVKFTKEVRFVGRTEVRDTFLYFLRGTDTCYIGLTNHYLTCNCSSTVDSIHFHPSVSGGGGGSGSVTSISQGLGVVNTPNPITTTGTVKVDTSYLATKAVQQNITNKNLGSGVVFQGTAIDTLYLNSVNKITAGANITATKTGKGSYTISSSGGGSPSGNQNNIQINRASAFYGSDSLKFGAGVLTNVGTIIDSGYVNSVNSFGDYTKLEQGYWETKNHAGNSNSQRDTCEFKTIKIKLTPDDIHQLNSVPVLVIPAPPYDNQAIEIISCNAQMTFVSDAYANSTLTLYANGAPEAQFAIVGVLNASNNAWAKGNPLTPQADINMIGKAAIYVMADADSGGHGDSDVYLSVFYRIIHQ